MSILLYLLNSLFGLAIHFFFSFWYCQTDLWSFNMNPLKLHLKVLFVLTFKNEMNLKKNNLYCEYANSRLIRIISLLSIRIKQVEKLCRKKD
jgi:hypothetical protein